MNSENVVQKTFVFFIVPNFSMIAFTSAIEALRIANRVLGRKFYDWRISSIDGEPVAASNSVIVSANTNFTEERKNTSGANKPAMLFVCSGNNVEKFNNKSVLAWLREAHNQGISIGGLCTGAHIIAAAGLLNERSCTIHWENIPGFTEAFPNAIIHADLFEIDNNIYTCAGGTSALDMMLHIISSEFDSNLINRICEMALTDRVRNPKDRQRLPLRARLGVQNSKVISVIELMEAHVSEPMSLVEISEFANLSRRQIERLFNHEMGRSPARYYLEIRLDRARHLLLQSAMPIIEVAIACGFVSASHFSKCYRELYSRSPQQERINQKMQTTDIDHLQEDFST